jgi:hypothetical protein
MSRYMTLNQRSRTHTLEDKSLLSLQHLGKGEYIFTLSWVNETETRWHRIVSVCDRYEASGGAIRQA